MTGTTIRRTLAICAWPSALAWAAAPAFAQTGQIKGKVVDAQGDPVDGAKVTIENRDQGASRSRPRPTRRGSTSRSAWRPGEYKDHGGEGRAARSTRTVKIGLDMAVHDFKLSRRRQGATGSARKMSRRRKPSPS